MSQRSHIEAVGHGWVKGVTRPPKSCPDEGQIGSGGRPVESSRMAAAIRPNTDREIAALESSEERGVEKETGSRKYGRLG